MENIDVPDPVLWYEGMPLYPHHFQQESIRFQSLFQTYLLAVGKYNYGVFEMDIDRVALGKNVFKLNKIFAIMPDGLVIKTDSYKTNLEYELPEPTSADKLGLGIYVALPKLIANNYILGKYPRYKKEEIADIVDFNTGEDATDVPRMAPNIILGTNDDLNTNFVKLKIAHLSVDKNMWDFQDYVPPNVAVTEDDDLYDLCSEICYGFRKKLSYIAELVFAKGAARQASFISEYFFYAQGLSSALPVLEGLLQTQDVHPYQLYLALCQMLGGISLLTKELTPPFPFPYEHEELLKTFTRMKKEIDEIVNAVIDEKMTKQNFVKENDVYWTTVRVDAIEKNCIYIGVRKQAGCTELDFMNWMDHAIICESQNIELSIHNRILGRLRENIEKTDDILPTRGVYLYKIVLQEADAEPIVDNVSLAILNPDDKENAPDEIFLYVPKKKGKKK